MHARTVLGEKGKGVLIREVSLFQGLNCMQELFLGKEKVSILERCPHFRGVLLLERGSTAYMYINVQHTGKEIYRNIQNPFVGNVL